MKKDLEVIHSKEASLFEIQIDGHRAHLNYSIEAKNIILHHTFVPPELRGRGLAAELAEAALRYAEDEGLSVVSRCSYIDRYLERRT